MIVTPITDLIEEMFAADAPLAAIIVAVRAYELQRDASRSASRDGRDGKALAAERARKYRARQRNKSGMAGPHVTADRHVTRHVTERDDCLLTSQQTQSQLGKQEATKKEDRTVVVEGRKAHKRKILGPLPSDWNPSAAHFEAAVKLGISREIITNKAEDMRIWAQANGVQKADWNATFHGFLRRAKQENGGINGRNSATQSRQSAGADFFAGLEKVAANIAGDRRMAGDADAEIPIGRVNIDG